jgi:hypothetical protein
MTQVQVQKSRKLYLESRQEFLSSEEKVIAKPVVIDNGSHITGWILSRGGNTLPSSRGGSRIFKTLKAVVSLCEEMSLDGFDVRGI